MKKLIAVVAVAVVIGLSSVIRVCAQTNPAKRFTVTGGVNRSAAVKSHDFRLKQFSASVTLSFRLSRRFSLNAGLSQGFERRPIALRTGISFRIY